MDIKTKISKILEKAKSTDSEGEAAVLIAKAEQLMEKHQIDAAELGDDSDPVAMSYGVTGQTGPVAYKTKLQQALAAYYGCRAVRHFDASTNNKKWVVELIGAESARITTQLMTDYVWAQCNAEARKLAKADGGKPGPIQRRIVNALAVRIYTIVAARETEAPKTAIAAKNALTIKNAVDAYVEANYEGLTTARSGKRSTTAAARDAANGISLHRQTGGSAGQARLT